VIVKLYKRPGGVTGAAQFKKRVRPAETLIVWFLFAAASFAVVISAIIIWTLAQGSWEFFADPRVTLWGFLTGTRWVPNGGQPSFGVLPLLSGTLLIAGGTLLIAAPLGVGAALFMSEFAGKRVRSILKPVIELLAGIPSVVYGFFALLVISPYLRTNLGASYFNALSAIIVMSVMVLPIIVSISDDAMRAVPQHLRDGSAALGATRWETSTRVVMPSASSGIMASILLGLGRALGETMVVTLAAGSVAHLTLNPLHEVQPMTAYIAQVATSDIPPGVAVSAAFAVGLLLFIITYVVNMIAGGIVDRIKRGGGMANQGPMHRLWRGMRGRFTRGVSALIPSHRRARADSRRPGGASEVSMARRYRAAKLGKVTTAACLAFAVLFLAAIMWSVLSQGVGGIDVRFLTGFPSSRPALAGIYPVIMGSVYLMLLTMLFAVPLGVGAAVYLNEFARDTRGTRFLRRIIQNLAGVPSIVFGLVGLAVFVRTMGLGPSLLAGSLTLAIMVMPIIVVATEEALRGVPGLFREAALSLGATRWQAVRAHVLPNALPGILTGSVLALSRAIGETAPILFIAAVFSKVAPSGLFDGFLALPVTIFYWTRHPNVAFHDLAASTIVVLLAILLTLNAFAIIIRQRAESRRQW
jgi:phosphate ABC transporter permease protein PstC/phosphate ABC transporter permease subunit PstA